MERWMRKTLLAFSALVFVAAGSLAAHAGSFNGMGQFVGTVNNQVTATISRYPSGGPALSAAIALLLEQDPRLADDVVYASRGLNNLQQQRAIGAGLAQAKRFFALCSGVSTETCRTGESQIAHAMLYADQVTLVAFNDSNGSVASADDPKNPSSSGIYIPGVGTRNCVSPSSPTGC
jgi:hypothetical protein